VLCIDYCHALILPQPNLKLFIPNVSKEVPQGVIPRGTFTSSPLNADAPRADASHQPLTFMPFSKGEFDLPPLTLSKFSPSVKSVANACFLFSDGLQQWLEPPAPWFKSLAQVSRHPLAHGHW
jgi:hypothetical protein